MAPDKKRSVQALLEMVYGAEISQAEALAGWLKQGVEARCFSLGDTIDDSLPKGDEKAVLLEGRVRVLGRDGSGKPRTLLLMEPGDIWDTGFEAPGELSFTVSSAEAVICTIPASLVMNHPMLRVHWERTLNQYTQARALAPDDSKDSVLSLPLQKPEPDDSASSHGKAGADTKPMPVGEVSSGWQCLEAALGYYNQPSPRREGGMMAVNKPDSLISLLESHGLKVRQRTLTWAQILNADYPLILMDDNQEFRWITGRQGNTLTDGRGGGESRYVPQNLDPKAPFYVLFVEPSRVSPEASRMQPFSLGWYLRLCVENWFLSTQMVVSSLVVQVFSLGLPVFYMVIFDRVFGRQNLNTLDVMMVGILLILVFDLLVKMLRSYVLSHQLEHMDKAGMELFLDRLFSIPLAKASTQLTRNFTERFPELARMNQAVASTLLITSLDVVFSVFLVIFLLLLHWQLALVSMAALVPIALMFFWTNPMVKDRAVRFHKEQRQCQIQLTEALEHSETIQSLKADRVFRWQVAQKIDEFLERGFSARYDRVSGHAGQAFIANLGTILTLYYGAHAVLQGEISYGVYMAINMLGRQVVATVQKMLMSIVQFQEAMGIMEQFKALYQEDVQAAAQVPALELDEVNGHIRFVDVRFRYHPEAPWALNNVNLEILPGQKVVLTGKSGAGKTTFIRLLQRLYEPNSGYVALDGFNLSDMDVECLRRHVGVAIQRSALFTGTIRENIAIGNPSATMKEILEAAAMAQLDQDLLRLPQGIESPVTLLGANFSGGQVARIALARIFLRRPGVLVLDEALSACDSTLQAAIYSQIFEKYKHATCLFVTDYLPVHRQADKIVVFNEGQIVEEGTYDQLMAKNGYYTHLHHAKLSLEQDAHARTT